MFTAYKEGDPNAAISVVPLETLTTKTHNTKETGIEAPVDTLDQSTTEGDDDMAVGQKKLY